MRVPEQLMRAMAAEAEAAREARAKVIAAEGEHKASRALRHAAEVIADSPAALQVGLLLLHHHPDHHVPVTISTNTQQYLCRAQQHHHLPRPHRHHGPLHGQTTTCPTSTTSLVVREAFKINQQAQIWFFFRKPLTPPPSLLEFSRHFFQWVLLQVFNSENIIIL